MMRPPQAHKPAFPRSRSMPATKVLRSSHPIMRKHASLNNVPMNLHDVTGITSDNVT